LGLVEAVPDHVDRGDVHRRGLEERSEAAVRVEVLAGADRDRRSGADRTKRNRVERVDLEPKQVVVSERARDAQDPLGGEVEVEVDDRLCEATRAFAKGLQQLNERLLELR